MLKENEKVHRLRKKEDFKLLLIKLSITFLLLFVLSIVLLPSYCQDENIKIIAEIETKIFHETFNKDPEESRIGRIEEFLFGSKNIKDNLQNRMNKISNSLGFKKQERAGVKPAPTQNIEYGGSPNIRRQRNYSIDPRTGFLTGENNEIVRDNQGIPISVMIGNINQYEQNKFQGPNYYNPLQDQYSLPTNPLPHFGTPGQLPLDLLFDQGGQGLQEDPEY